MTKTKTKWLIGSAVVLILVFITLSVSAFILSKRFEPYIREQAILYLHDRFDSEIELAALRVRMPQLSSLQLLFKGSHGAVAGVEGEGVVLRHKGRRDIPPMFVMKRFTFDVDLETVFDNTKVVHLVMIDGMEINIPPKGERPTFGSNDDQPTEREDTESASNTIIEEVIITNSALTVLPKEHKKSPLRFNIHSLRLEALANSVAMKYDAALTNAKPPGEIKAKGTFGPWVATAPGDSPLAGEYVFDDADLGVFSSIAGILDSTGQFQGSLSSIDVKGQASVPDFRLKRAGNPVALKTEFQARVDGTNGDTILKPVIGSLGTTKFTTSGGIIKNDADTRRTISLDVSMPNGNLRDLLRLAMKETPFMQGQISLQTKIEIPPLTATVREKLILDGQFEISNGKFLRSTVQEKIDSLSRRGQGQPKNEEISQVISRMAGTFHLENEVITFRSLSFAIPGSGVDLAGSYNLDHDVLDFHGTLKLQAKVSQTMTGWKRWVLKPIDPFFSKQGAGTLLRIQIVGSAKDPKFGRERGD
jgi:hypothetical protein